MAPQRRMVTEEMLLECKAQGFYIAKAARHLGLHKSTVAAACDRFNIVLPLHPFSAQRVSPRSRVWVDMIDNEKKPKVRLSASPAAIARALKKLDAAKRSMARET